LPAGTFPLNFLHCCSFGLPASEYSLFLLSSCKFDAAMGSVQPLSFCQFVNLEVTASEDGKLLAAFDLFGLSYCPNSA
jgi:hypothetical protein